MAPDRPTKTPYAEEWLAFEEQSGGRFTLHGTIYEIREQFDGLGAKLQSMFPPLTDDVVTEDHKTEEGVPVCVYKPANAASNLPTGLYIHSGGWACGSIDNEDHLTRQLVLAVPCILVSVEYRLAPENPFLAAVDDCVSAYKWIATAAAKFSGDFTKPFTVGGSAGGNLSVCTALSIIASKDAPAPHGIFALCPAVVATQAVEHLPEALRAYQNSPETYADAAMIDKAAVETSCGLSPLPFPSRCGTNVELQARTWFRKAMPTLPIPCSHQSSIRNLLLCRRCILQLPTRTLSTTMRTCSSISSSSWGLSAF